MFFQLSYHHGCDSFFTRSILLIFSNIVISFYWDPDVGHLQTRVSISFRWRCKWPWYRHFEEKI